MQNPFITKTIGSIKAVFRRAWLIGKKKESKDSHFLSTEEFQLPDSFEFCHKDKVHIFVRGMADGKLHVARNRHYSDFRFYKKQGLKVFCAVCRKRML